MEVKVGQRGRPAAETRRRRRSTFAGALMGFGAAAFITRSSAGTSRSVRVSFHTRGNDAILEVKVLIQRLDSWCLV